MEDATLDRAFARASGAPRRTGNAVRLLKDAAENYPAWLDAIAGARRTVHCEMYIIHDDEEGERFADALIQKAREGVAVRVLYDWMGARGSTPSWFWHRMRRGKIEVRCYNPLRISQPLGWISRDHRKTIIVDGTIAFVTGLCIGRAWVGNPAKKVAAWRDTGIELRGPAVGDVDAAFADSWMTAGEPLPSGRESPPTPVGDTAVRVVATAPAKLGLFRVDQFVASIVSRRLWLTDAYYGGTASYVQALGSAARDGVDVRLLVPGATDIPLLRPVSRAGYRPLLEAGVRVFEWNGSMIHAKTAVADGRWARVGSTNLNVASWIGNRELDVIVEDERFAAAMEAMFLEDLNNATEVVLAANRVQAVGGAARPTSTGGGSSGRAMAGALRVGSTVAATISNTRVLEPVEGIIAIAGGLVLAVVAWLAYYFPRGFSYPFAIFSAWVAAAVLLRGVGLGRWDALDPQSTTQRRRSVLKVSTRGRA
jgi:cardiolipin synthase